MTPAILSARDLVFSYGDVAGLDRLSLEVSEGRRLAIVGANGAGKTTLLLHLNGTNRPAAGAVLLRGEPVTYDRAGLTALRTAVGLVFQNPDDQLFAGTVYQDVSFGPLNIGLSEDVTRSRVEDALEALEIAHLRDRPTHMLSYGQKKRAAIAGAVAMRPEVLILDEPMAGLDPSGSWHLMGLLTRLHEAGTTLVVATHDMSLAYEWADEVAVLRDGRIVAHGEPPGRDARSRRAGALRSARAVGGRHRPDPARVRRVAARGSGAAHARRAQGAAHAALRSREDDVPRPALRRRHRRALTWAAAGRSSTPHRRRDSPAAPPGTVLSVGAAHRSAAIARQTR